MLCQTAIVYGREIDGTVLSFGHEGVLYLGSFVMYDKQTDSLWVHATGEAVKGPLKGKVLPFLPSTITTWKRWRAAHPKTSVLTGQRGSAFMGRFGLLASPDDYGLSVGQPAAPKLYPMALLMKQRVIEDTLGGTPIVVLYDAEGGGARAWKRGAHSFSWKDGALVDQKGRTWDVLRAKPADGEGDGLEAVPATTWLIERWKGFYPKGSIHGTARPSGLVQPPASGGSR